MAMAVESKLLLRVEEASEMMGLHRSRLWPLMASGRLHSLKIGKSRRIPIQEVRDFIHREMAAQHDGYQPPAA